MPGLMDGKRGLVMGVANDHSIAWGIAKTLAQHGAKLAFTYQGDALAKRVKPLAEEAGSSFVMPCDVEDITSVDAVFDEIKGQWGTMDFLVHAVAFSDKNELKGRYADSTRENFIRTMVISCYAFTEAAKRAAALMPNGGAMVTLTYNGGLRAMPNYNVMGVAKSALEASVRYLAVDFGAQKIRVNAISAGPIRTLAGAGITDARYMFAFQQKFSPLGRGVTLEELGGAELISFLTFQPVLRAKSTSLIPGTTSLQCPSPTLSRKLMARWRVRINNPPFRGAAEGREPGIHTFRPAYGFEFAASRRSGMAKKKRPEREPRPLLFTEIRRGRSGPGSSPWSTPPRSLSRTFPSRFRAPIDFAPAREVASANRRSGRHACQST